MEVLIILLGIGAMFLGAMLMRKTNPMIQAIANLIGSLAFIAFSISGYGNLPIIGEVLSVVVFGYKAYKAAKKLWDLKKAKGDKSA